MHRRILAAAVLTPAALLAAALPASATTPVAPTSTIRINTVRVVTTAGARPLYALRSSTQTCAGTLVYSTQATVSGKAVAELDVYATAKNNGTVIACYRHLGATRGVRLYTKVALGAVHGTTSTKGVGVTAYGNFVSYAGPAAIGGVTIGQCVLAQGTMKYLGKSVIVTSPVMCAQKAA